ncbi:MAG: hypothetical protein F4Z37_01425 [Rhodothermaceae bacterium]|nr:hypothetical protein [Rhodothermaceae bacterium]MXX57670.1 hypothetical protein [Rhodothermaceae bacterium]MYJ55000.1 hypothetical protein [Rhodothermaceae bacterium]
MSNEELVTLYDKLVDQTDVFGVGRVREGYRFRRMFRIAKAVKEQSRIMGKHTKAIHWYWVTFMTVAVVNLAFGVWSAIGYSRCARNAVGIYGYGNLQIRCPPISSNKHETSN